MNMTRSKYGSGLAAAAFAITALSLAQPAAASPLTFGSSVAAAAGTACGRQDSVGPTLLGATGFVDASSGPCTVVGTLGAQGSAVSGASIGIHWDVSGQAFATNYGSSANADVVFFDTVTLNSPLIHYTGGVNVIAGDTYTLNVTAPDGGGATAFLRYQVVEINGNPAPASYQDSVTQTSSGLYKGALRVDFNIGPCPCSFEFSVIGHVNADLSGVPGNASATFHDPLYIDLPPGWTYTLASDSAIPEPSPLLPTAIALVVGGLMTRVPIKRRLKA
jgi:hypothetical protein